MPLFPAPRKAKYRGIYQHRRKFIAQVFINGRKLYLGMFSTPEEAAEKYNEAAFNYFGDKAILNVLA
jgi:hypothetical protein